MESCPSPPAPAPTPEPESLGSATQPPEGPPGICLAPFQEPGFHYPLPTLILLGDLQARRRRQQESGRMASHSRAPAVRASHFCPRFRHPFPQFYSRTQGSESPPIRGTQESQLQRIPRTKASESSIPRTQAPRPPSLLPSKPSIQVLSFQGPCVSAPPIPRWDPASGSPPSPPRDAVSAPPEPLDPGEAELTDQGPIPAPGVFLRLRLRQRGAEDGAGQTAGTGWTT